MKYKPRIAIYIASAVAIIVVISSPYVKNSFNNFFWIRESFYWFQDILKAPIVFSSSIINNYIYLIDVKKENILIKKRIVELNTKQMLLNDLRNENSRLRTMLTMRQTWKDIPLYGADIISHDISLIFKTVIIDKGSSQGFYVDMPVVRPEGLAGRVISVSQNTSQVLLLTDVNSSVPSVIENSRVKGIIKGLGNGKLSFDYVRSDEDVKVGDRIVTSDLLGIFPKGIFIGTVRSIRKLENKMFADITVSPAFNAEKAEEVFGIGRVFKEGN